MSMEVNYCTLWQLTVHLRYTLRYVMPRSQIERYQCSTDTFCHHQGRRWRHQAFNRMIPLCLATWCYILQDHHLHAPFFPTPIPVAPTRQQDRDNGCIVSLHHLEWHFDGAACKNNYIILSFQPQLLKWWAWKPHKCTLRMAERTLLPNLRKTHVQYPMWNPQDDLHLNNLITQNASS